VPVGQDGQPVGAADLGIPDATVEATSSWALEELLRFRLPAAVHAGAHTEERDDAAGG
jgi:hypothetical protein